MDNSLLATKFVIPPARPGLVQRPRLTGRLRSGLSSGLILVSAPAGFGKTTLVSEWARLDNASCRTAWLSLDPSENDPLRFWSYFVAALQSLQPKIGDIALSLLRSPHPVPIQSILTALINDLTEIAQDFVLVLDDYHFIKSPEIHEGLAFVLKHLPFRMHLAILTRIDPPLPLALYRGRGILLEIGADELRFTIEEVADLFSTIESPLLSAENIQALNARAEGWVAGLKMALLSLRGEKDITGFISSFSGSQRYIMDYLIEEVLEKQDAETQAFLLQTSILERFNGPVCDALTGGRDSLEVLHRLEKDNLFLVPLDASREWYRYEHLFAGLLRHRLERQYGTEKMNGLRKKACRWHEENGRLEEALQYALDAQDWENAIRLVSNPVVNLPNMHSATMHNWLRRIPIERLRGNTNILFNYIWALEAVHQWDAAEAQLKYLEEAFPQDNIVQGRIAVARTSIAMGQGDNLRGEEYAKRAISLLPPPGTPNVPPGYTGERPAISLLLGWNYINKGLFAEAEPLVTEAYHSLRRVGSAVNTIVPLTYMAIIKTARAEPHRAVEMLNQAIWADETSPSTALPHLVLSAVCYELNDLEAAVLHLQRAKELSQLAVNTQVLDLYYLYLARVRLVRGDETGALEALQDADRLLARNGGGTVAQQARHAAFHVMLSNFMEDSEAESRWLKRLSEYAGSIPFDIPTSARHLFLKRSNTENALEGYRMAYQMFMKTGIKSGVMLVSLFRALDSPALGDALPHLAEALAIARLEGYVRPFADEGLSLAPLLKKAISAGIDPEYARKLLGVIETEDRERRARKGLLFSSVEDSSPLSEREREVLLLMSTGLSNQQIAAKLIISLSTTKTHVHNILEKLYARDRLQAINRARELKLLTD